MRMGRSFTIGTNAGDADQAHIIGRFLGANDEPVPGVTILLGKRRVAKHRSALRMDPFESLVVIYTSNQVGRFDVGLQPEAGHEYTLRTHAPGHTPLEMLLGEIAPY